MQASTPTAIRDGDHVLLMFSEEDIDHRLVETMTLALETGFPGVKFTFVYGVTGALVLPRGDLHA